MNSLNFLRDKPLDNWIEHFLSPTKFLALLTAEERDVKAIGQLANQFVEQAQAVDKELELLKEGILDEDDITYSRRKAAKLWLCALSCLASMDWNLDLLKESCNPLMTKALFNRLIFFCFPERNIGVNDDASTIIFDRTEDISAKLNTTERIFAAWFYAIWILKMDVAGQFPETVAKPTVSNPANQFDSNLALAEQLRNCVAEHRLKSEDAVMILEQILNMGSIKEFNVPKMESFMDDLFKEYDQLPDVVNLPGTTPRFIPKPNFLASFTAIKAPDWRILTRYSILCYHFASGHLTEAKGTLSQIVSDWSRRTRGFGSSKTMAGRMTSIDTKEIGGYCAALQVPSPKGITSLQTGDEKIIYTPTAFDERWLEGVCSSKCGSMTRRAECERIASATLSIDFLVENLADQLANGLAVTMGARQKLCSHDASIVRFVRALVRKVTDRESSEEERIRIEMGARLLASIVPAFAAELTKAGRSSGHALMAPRTKCVSCKPVEPIPDISAVKEFLDGGPPYWRMLLSYDRNELKSVLTQLGMKFTLPYRFQVSNMVGEIVLPAFVGKPGYEYIALLLGKLEHLAKIGDIQQWTSFGNECVKELGVIGRNQDVQMRFTCDVVRVQLDKWHRLFPVVPGDAAIFVHVTQELQKTVQSLVQASLTMPPSSMDTIGSMMLQTVAFFINTTEWEFILKSSPKLKSPFLDVAKVLAAYMTSDAAMKKKVAEGAWFQIMHSTFEDSSAKRRNDGSSVRDHSKLLISRSHFLRLLRLIKEPLSIAFLLSFVGRIFNHALMTQPSKSGEENARIFVQHADLWQSTFESSSAPVNFWYVSECLETILRNAILVNPINAFWLRSFADYRYACEQYADALVLYMETCVTCSDSLTKPFPDNVVDDVMWYKVQRCLRACGSETLAAIVCQLMRDPQEHYVLTAKALLESPGDTVDGSTVFFPLVSDMNLLEFMHDVYEKLGMTRKSQLLLQAASVPEMNTTNVVQNERYRRNGRLMRVLCSLIFRIHF